MLCLCLSSFDCSHPRGNYFNYKLEHVFEYVSKSIYIDTNKQKLKYITVRTYML